MAKVEVDKCESCGRTRGERHVATVPAPDIEELEGGMDDGGCEATDGCWVEPDGVCEHGHQSWLLRMGLI